MFCVHVINPGIKFQTALKHLVPDTNTFVNEVTVNGETANATVEFV